VTVSTSRACRGGDGIVEGVFLFHRHGDRSPARILVPDTYAEHENEFWAGRIPKGASLYDSLSDLFPTDIHFSNNNGRFFDTKRAPSGFLTWKGMEQMRLVGRECGLRYSRLGQRQFDEADNADVTTGREMLKHWDIKAFSTCYLRTVKSVQCFLHGLLGTEDQRSYEDFEGCDIKAQSLRDEIAREAARQRPIDPKDLISVYVRDRSIDTLNAFDRNPDLMKNLVREVVDTPCFQKHDALAEPLASKLSDFLPGLLAPGQKLFGGPSGINWIHAADHFICRSSHGLPYSKFCSEANDDRNIEEALASMHRPVIQHLAWRFRQWYKSPPLLAAIAAPPLREIEGEIRQAIESGGRRRAPMVIYSCHDVTILSLLYGLGAEFLEDDAGSEWKSFWPSYASTLVIELVRIRKEGKGNIDNTHRLRILMNGSPVRIVALRNKSDENQLLRLSDFTAIIDELVEAGGWGESGRLADDPACSSVKRDMSGWTG